MIWLVKLNDMNFWVFGCKEKTTKKNCRKRQKMKGRYWVLETWVEEDQMVMVMVMMRMIVKQAQ